MFTSFERIVYIYIHNLFFLLYLFLEKKVILDDQQKMYHVLLIRQKI